mmetsp:Transcript_24458/g.78600  ORF Transcript_24458/g.78600 Transcript_24458/m.78600 type:complete len:779 (+) Transcript_24458:47-2383(+)
MVSQMFAAAIAVQPSVGVAALDLPSTSTSPPQSGFALWHHFFASYPPPPPPSAAAYPSKLRFDRSFLFGVATAPAHVEDNLHDAWLPFCNTTELHPNGRPHCHAWRTTPRAAERLRFWSEPEVEIGLAAALNSGVFRMGVDWSRLAPTSPSAFPNASAPVAPACSAFCEAREEAKVGASPGAPPEGCACSGVQDFEALARYREIVGMAKAKGMKVVLTLFHHSLPKWALADGGWTNGALVDYFAAFSADVIDALAADTEFLITFNEPTVFAMLTHCAGIWPPGPKKTTSQGLRCLAPIVGDYARAVWNIQAAHRAVYADAKARGRGSAFKIGVAHNVGYNVAEHVWDEAATAVAKALLKFSFIDAIRDTLDFCGLNYYGKEITRGGSIAIRDDEEYSESGRVVYPAGLYSLLKDFDERYRDDETSTIQSYIVTENGISDASDVMRPAYIVEHLLAVARAVDEGVPVSGYLHWTISDNWEWADGYCPKFGLAAVNRSDPLLRRVPRDSYHLFAKVVRSRRVTVAQRHAAWRRVTTAAANGEMKEVCRSGDALGSLDTPDRWPVLGGTTLPDGRVVDWRYDDAKVESPEAEDTAIVTNFIEHSMALSSATGFDPAAAVVSALAGFSHEFVGRPPPPPTLPGGGGGQDTAAVLASVLDALDAMHRRPLPPPPPPGKGGADMFGHFIKGFADALDGDATAAEPAEPGAARSFWPFEKAGSARAGSSLWLAAERRPDASGDGRRGGPAPLAAAAALACLAFMVAVRRRRRSSEGASSEGGALL